MFGTYGLGGQFFNNFNQLTDLIYKLNLIICLYSTLHGDLNEKGIQKRGNMCKYMGFSNGSEVKNPPTMQETWQEPWVQFLPCKYPMEKATHSGILAWKIPWMEEPRRLQSMGSQRNWT